MLPQVPYKEIHKIPGMESYKDYIVDINGNVYSTKGNKVRKLKPGWAFCKENPFLRVRLYNGHNNAKWFYVHILVASAFLTEEQKGKYVVHKNQNRSDNSLNNIVCTTHKANLGVKRPKGTGVKKEAKKRVLHVKEYELNENIRKEIDLIHRAALEKGLHMSESFSFINEVVEDMLEEYCSKRGLKKILYRMRNEGG